MQQSADLLALVDAFAAQRERLTQLSQLAAAQRLAGFAGWYDSESITGLAAAIVAPVESAQRQTVALTNAYLARAAAAVTGRTVEPVTAVDVTALRQGVSHAGAYGRLTDEYRYLRSLGRTDAEALQSVHARAVSMAATDTDLAFRAQTQRFTEVHRLDYRRVIHPELAREGTCGLCVAASDRVYHRGDLMPIHARCNCTVIPVAGSRDPAAELNRQALDDLYARSGGTAADKLKRARYTVHEHGELGPVLTDPAHHWRGPKQVAAA